MSFAPFLRESAQPASEVLDPPGRLEALALPFTDARLETAYRYWQQKAAGRAMPSRTVMPSSSAPAIGAVPSVCSLSPPVPTISCAGRSGPKS